MKVLIISHNPISTYQSMGKTFLSLFSEFKKKELCQLYIYPTVPDVDACESYYRITDRNVVNSYFRLGKMEQRVLNSSDVCVSSHSLYESDDDKTFLTKHKKDAGKLLLRDIAWKFAHWYTNELKTWLDEQIPTCIFLAPGESKFIYDIALKISHKRCIPIVTYVCDEFYFINEPSGLTAKLQLRQLQKKIEQLMKETDSIVTISDELNQAYSSRFKKKAYTIYTGSNMAPVENVNLREKIRGLTYMGNLAYGRFDSLKEISDVLDEINLEQNENYKLFIYTRVLSEEQKSVVESSNVMQYCGYVTGDDFTKALNDADVLVHVESFEPEDVDRVKNSISTKIADTLCSGKPMLAYGPKELASIRYLDNNSGACTVSNHSELKYKIELLISIKYRISLSNHALHLAMANHSSLNNSRLLYNTLKSLSEE